MSDLNAIHFRDCIKNCFIASIAVCILKDHSFITIGVVMVAKQLLYGLMLGSKL
jgi:hypothetical protein